MSDDKKTIRIPEDDFEKARQRKEDAGQTWAEYLTDDNRGSPDASEIADELKNELSMVGDPGVSHDAEDVARLIKMVEELEQLAYDDVVAACERALQQTLPNDALQDQ